MITKINSLRNHEGFMKYFKNTSWLFGEKILRMFVGLLVGVWVARYLGPEQFGLFSYAQSFVGLFIVFTTLGLDSIVVRELVKKEINQDEIVGTAFLLKFFGALLIFCVLALSVQFTSNDRSENILIFIIASGSLFQSFNVIDMYFQSKVLSRYVVYANIITLFTSSILKITLIFLNAPLIAFAWTLLFDSFVLMCGFIYFFYKNDGNLKRWKFNLTLAKNMLKDSYPLIIAGVINSIYMKVDQVMINEMLGSIQVGYYSAAVRLSEVWFSVGVIISNSLFPAIINSKKISEELYYKRIQYLFLFLTLIAYFLSVIVYFLSDKIIIGLYGPSFEEASSVLSIHIFSAIFVYLGVSSGRWLIAENKAKLDLYRNMSAMVINVALNLILIKKYGIIGSAYASLIAYIISFYLFDLIRQDTRKIFILKTKSLLLRK